MKAHRAVFMFPLGKAEVLPHAPTPLLPQEQTMADPHSEREASSWIYLKLYLGRSVNRMDRLLIDLSREATITGRAQAWFYIRYVDEHGIHIRLRAKAHAGDEQTLRRNLIDVAARRLGRLHELPPGDYFPMVAMPGFEQAVDQISSAHNDIDVVEAPYEPEFDKFGSAEAMDIAEGLFHASSIIACQVLADEENGKYSRKDLVPSLLDETFRAFLPPNKEALFWHEYSYYWLNGKSPAANDWREKFIAKGRSLSDRSIRIVPEEQRFAAGAIEPLRNWRSALTNARTRYAALGSRLDASAEVLCFNFAHLMNNRLGLGTLEEAYMGALLEQRAVSSALETA
jgi:thiopeptide-type bacteriocin biosynthesis protein